MLTKPYLMVPGPTVVPERVLAAMNRPMINHRGPQYEQMFRSIVEKMKSVFQTAHDVLVFPTAGTGMMEAAIVNVLSPGDKVLAVSIGVFGDRLAQIAREFKAEVETLNFAWGQSASPEVLAQRLAQDTNNEIKAILITHNETSTAVTNDIEALAKARGNHPALLIVDAVSSLGAIPLKTDEWGLDVVFTGSQKGLMIPPGLGFMVLSERAWQANKQSTMPKYYWDARKTQKSLLKGQNPYTPPVSLLYGLQEALLMMEEEGYEKIFSRHRLLANVLRQGLKAIGLELLANDHNASPVVTAVKAPVGIGGKSIQKYMREFYGITIAGGQQDLENKIFRIGHLGYVAQVDVLIVLSFLEMTLLTLGFPVELGAGVKCAQQALLNSEKQ